MKPRHIILREPYMEGLIDEPAIETMPHEELATLDAFMAFCFENGLEPPVQTDILAFAELCQQSARDLHRLDLSLCRLGFDDGLLQQVRAVTEAVKRQTHFKAYPKGPNRDYDRTVSVPLEQLPTDWQETLLRLRTHAAFSPEVLKRMQARLCCFAWSASQAGHPVDLALFRPARPSTMTCGPGPPRRRRTRASLAGPIFDRLGRSCIALQRYTACPMQHVSRSKRLSTL
ncbi:hypothetical protein [Limimaricola cinnabarinus]|uniref:hypothetical protein n=1 Tax=Limimaricola cinnabarinus TaxID=1125964 RepID=UPI0005ECD9F4|nr:hypothetical protein [Limimaricola cinnabarinus]